MNSDDQKRISFQNRRPNFHCRVAPLEIDLGNGKGLGRRHALQKGLRPMKDKSTKKENLAGHPAQQSGELHALAITDDEIHTFEFPELRKRPGKQGVYCRPQKRPITIRVDAFLIDWFKRRAHGKGYQTEINRALIEYVVRRQRPGGALS